MEVYILCSSKSHISDKAYHTYEEAYDAIKKMIGGYNSIHKTFGGPIVGKVEKFEESDKKRLTSPKGLPVGEIFNHNDQSITTMYIKKLSF
jgi:hypothetical protein